MDNELAIPIDDSLVILYDPENTITVINGTKLYYREGVWCEKDETGEFMPDWSLTWFYTDKHNPEDYYYYEQDPPETAIHNLNNILINTGE